MVPTAVTMAMITPPTTKIEVMEHPRVEEILATAPII